MYSNLRQKAWNLQFAMMIRFKICVQTKEKNNLNATQVMFKNL